MNGDWFPTTIEGQATWFRNFVANHAAITTVTGIAADDSKAAVDAAGTWLAANTEVVRLSALLDAAYRTQQNALSAANEPVRALVRQVKASPKVTPALLTLLDIASTPDTAAARTDAEKPVLTLAQGPGLVDIRFVKHGRGGIRLYCKRGTETAFTVVGTYTASPAHDRRPNLLPGQAEHREYYAWYVEYDEPVGTQGDTAGIAAAPTPG